jgi:hyaluronoglucosaminidase
VAEFAHRGVVEGFYGPPWTHADRLWCLEQLGALGMNTYVYAPKHDALHRARWREAYSAQALRRFAELVEVGARHGVSAGFALSPGLEIRYSDGSDRERLASKLGAFCALGSRFLALALDDVPTELQHAEDRAAFPNLAAAQVALANEVRASLPADAVLWLVPTEYLGLGSSPYLEELGAGLDARIEVAWTGRTLISPEIRSDEAARRAALLRRRLLIWDNTPVNDGPMRPMLHLGPYRGRDPELAASASGVLLNPMPQARASFLQIATAAEYLRDPQRYDPESAWERALARFGGPAARALRVFASAQRFSPLEPHERDRELETALAELSSALEKGEDPIPPLDALEPLLRERLGAAAAVRESLADARLLDEIEPWLRAHVRETRRIEAAAELLRVLAGGATRERKSQAFLSMEGRFTREPEPAQSSYGPRRVLYPQLVELRADEVRFGTDPALFLDRCLSDEFVRLAEQAALRLLGQAGSR